MIICEPMLQPRDASEPDQVSTASNMPAAEQPPQYHISSNLPPAAEQPRQYHLSPNLPTATAEQPRLHRLSSNLPTVEEQPPQNHIASYSPAAAAEEIHLHADINSCASPSSLSAVSASALAGASVLHLQPHSQPPNVMAACVYLALRCSQCGELRQALAALPLTETVACPICGTACLFALLGKGLTSRALPFHEVHMSKEQGPYCHAAMPCAPYALQRPHH